MLGAFPNFVGAASGEILSSLADVPLGILAGEMHGETKSTAVTRKRDPDTRCSCVPRFEAAVSNRIVCTYRVSSTAVLITGKIRKRKVSGTRPRRTR